MELSLINLLLVLLLAAVGGAVVSRLGYPSMMGEMVAGIIFGPMLLGWVQDSAGLHLLAEIGVFLMMLYIGIEVDHRDLMKASWSGLLAALGGFMIPMIAGYWAVSHFYGKSLEAGLFIGLAMGITSLATKSRALIELKLLGTRVANVLLAAALVCDTLALVVFAGIIGFAESASPDLMQVLVVLIKAALFFGVAILIGLRVFPLIGELFRKLKFTERTTNFTLVIMIGLFFAELAELAGLHSIIGAFIAGLFIREEVLKRKVSHEVSGMVHDVSIGFLAPVFFVSAGFKVDISVLWTDAAFLFMLVGIALVTKVLGTWLFYAPTRRGWREGLVIGAGMNGQGAVAIIIAEIGFQMGLITQSIFSTLIFMAFFTTALEPVFLKAGARWLRRRDALVRADDGRKMILIAGATPLARSLGRELAKSEPVCLLDNNRNLVQTANMEGLHALQGNILNEDFFDVAGAAQARVFLAMTTNQEVNRIASTQARNMFGVPQSWMWPAPAPAIATPPGGLPVSENLPMGLSAWNEWITTKAVEPVSFSMTRSLVVDSFDGMVNLLQVMPLTIERDGQRYPAMVMDELRKGDVVVGIRHRAGPEDRDIFEELIAGCPVLDVEGRVDAGALFAKAGEKLSPLVGLPPEEVAALLMAREEESTTVVAPGLAIPHVILEGDQPVAMLVARSRDGTSFPGQGDTPVQFTFVIIGSRQARNLHLRILSAIAQLYQKPGFEDMLTAARDPEAMRQVILGMRRKV